MNQSMIAGIGSVYADEILYHLGVLPQMVFSRLAEGELKKVFYFMKNVLSVAVEKGADTKCFPSGFLNAHRCTNGKRLCGGKTATAKLDGLTACFYPACQQ